ncbi:hypothetical protein H696_01734 [Fonticula alba]|uniref:Glycolipid transfer protein domain-containing protein n=1 Tax=Fonticula alba TaxID=691883 RepID=A0A058ZD55_FONAL|nr:hypothetical protein H696_01734 [Fonticula alba]KCV72340.1 hypothetical protein H696_01734 [Fonticula alba]|eukprot:XP_009493918.1 hypothetical protein H696_01734 [Fonticula alba]
MATNFFATMDKTWIDVASAIDAHPNGEIPTEIFIAAARELSNIFDILNSMAFSPVKKDMVQNIDLVEQRFLSAGPESQTLNQLIANERKLSTFMQKGKSPSRALLWYKRGMEFLAQAFLRCLENPTEELAVSFSKSYETTLQQHHGFLVRNVFSLAVKAAPYREDFLKSLAKEDDREQLLATMTPYIHAYVKVCKVLVKLYDDEDLERPL